MKAVKCKECGKVLAKNLVGSVEIKCPKCGVVNKATTEQKPYGERLVYNQK
jgi:phage FluMu protein Com